MQSTARTEKESGQTFLRNHLRAKRREATYLKVILSKRRCNVKGAKNPFSQSASTFEQPTPRTRTENNRPVLVFGFFRYFWLWLWKCAEPAKHDAVCFEAPIRSCFFPSFHCQAIKCSWNMIFFSVKTPSHIVFVLALLAVAESAIRAWQSSCPRAR